MKQNTYGAIDIGSNAIRLLIMNAEEYPDEVVFKKLSFVRLPIRLGEDVFSKGKIGRDKATRLVEAMKAYRHLMNVFGVKEYRAFATSAMREASNGGKIANKILKESGIGIEIISGNREAETIFNGGVSETLDHDKSYLYVDVGGGSTEIIVYSHGIKKEERSFPLGTVRMLEGKVKPAELEGMKKWLSGVAPQYRPSAVIGSGGNINKVKRLLGKKEKENVTYTELEKLNHYISGLGYEERIHLLKLNDYRADVIVPAMKFFETVCATAGIGEIIIPGIGLADGIIRELYQSDRRQSG